MGLQGASPPLLSKLSIHPMGGKPPKPPVLGSKLPAGGPSAHKNNNSQGHTAVVAAVERAVTHKITHKITPQNRVMTHIIEAQPLIIA